MPRSNYRLSLQCIIVVTAGVLSFPGYSQALALKKSERLSVFRAELLRDGWKPVETYKMEGAGQSGAQLEHTFGDAGVMFRVGYHEVEFCSGTGMNYCFFNYRRQDHCLQVSTRGEYHPEFKAEPLLTGWRFVCPKPGNKVP